MGVYGALGHVLFGAGAAGADVAQLPPWVASVALRGAAEGFNGHTLQWTGNGSTGDARALLAKKAALEAELKAAKAKKSAASAAAGAWCLFCSCHARPHAVFNAPPPHAPIALRISHKTLLNASPRPPFLQGWPPTRRRLWRPSAKHRHWRRPAPSQRRSGRN